MDFGIANDAKEAMCIKRDNENTTGTRPTLTTQNDNKLLSYQQDKLHALVTGNFQSNHKQVLNQNRNLFIVKSGFQIRRQTPLPQARWQQFLQLH